MDNQAPAHAGTILVVDDDPIARTLYSKFLEQEGYAVTLANDGAEALRLIAQSAPDLVLSDVAMPVMSGLELLAKLRENPDTVALPVLLLTAHGDAEDVIAGLDLGADDYLVKPVESRVLKARVRSKLRRQPIPVDQLFRDYRTGLLSTKALLAEVKREIVRAEQHKSSGCLALVGLWEYGELSRQFSQIDAPIGKQFAGYAQFDGSPLELVGSDSTPGRYLLLLPEIGPQEARKRLQRLARRLISTDFMIGAERVRLTPVIGFAPLKSSLTANDVYDQALAAYRLASTQLDLEPILFDPAMKVTAHRAVSRATQTIRQVRAGWRIPRQHARSIFQIALTSLIGLVIPFLIYAAFGAVGLDITFTVYLLVVVALLGTAALILFEGLLSLRQDPLPEPSAPYPKASAIIAAYLPNEAATIVSTIEAFLRLDYPADLQIVLAYNTPRDMPIEQTLADIARRDSRFLPLRVPNSTSKAQNVNAALTRVEGDLIGVFDADHQPDPDSFRRAWAWLSNGYDVVQGHCLIRNGDANLLAELVAVEFEMIYAVSHPGRARMHQFGIFGGSNGYWCTSLLRETRMHGFMLTEDIDSSMRIVAEGHRIKSDPLLVSRELAPVALKALWNQRLRWAQGWFQVSIKHSLSDLFSARLTRRQKLGIYHLLIWREIYPWVSMQIIPIIAYWAWKRGGLDRIDWFVPIFVVTSIVTFATGPLQLYFVYRVGHATIRRRRGWLLHFLLLSFFYTEFKNVIGRVAQVKEVMRERVWRTTPRS